MQVPTRKITRRTSLLCATGTVVTLLAVAAPAQAQDATGQEAASSTASNEIIVTARKQEESLQDAPVAVAVVGQETINDFRIDEATDLMSRVPALSVQVGGSGAGAQIGIRGINSSNISNAFDSAVAINVDGIAVSTQRILQTAFFDVAQVEVLKGPQPLFFGKSTSAGVLTLRSADPTPDWEIAGKASYEFEEEGYTIGGYVSGPLSDAWGIRLAAEYQDIEKFVELQDNVPALDPDKGLTNFVGRLTLAFEPDDRFNAKLKLNYNRQRSETLNAFTDMYCGGNGMAEPSFLAVFGAAFAPTHDCNIRDNRFPGPDGLAQIDSPPVGLGLAVDDRDLTQSFNDTDLFLASLEANIGITDDLTLTLLSGYVDLDNVYNDTFNSTGQNPDGSAAGFQAPFHNTLQQFTQEVRLASDFDGPFNFQLGAFYESRESGLITAQNAFLPAAFLGPDPVTGFTYDWLADRPLSAEAVSIYASGSLDLSDTLNLSGGVRWTDENKDTTIGFPYVHSFITTVFGAVSSGFFVGPIKFSDSNISPEVVLKYSPNEDLNVYAAFKTGFKSGGVDNNTLPTGTVLLLNNPDPAVAEAAADSLRFDSETSIGGEIGVRSQFANRTVTLNATVFYYVFDDQQIQNFDVNIFNFSTFNAGETTTKGIDIDWRWVTPVDGLNLSGAIAYLDAAFSDTFISVNGTDLDGRDAARAPKWSGNVAMDWDIPLGNSLELGLNSVVSYTDDYFTTTTNPTALDPATGIGDFVQDSYFLVDASVSVGAPDDSWKLSLIGTNLFDTIFVNTSGAPPFGFPGTDDLLVTLNRGRQVFVEAAFKF
ncbi:TonB-dependent receptor [Altererythrobacter sp. MF3-039]|uniref:TonB-dependent receptor n=1 Tax=Altererythrobacter sp. MF3-039 TaxID=3252901 RepID=UPI00390C6A02